VVQGIPIPNRIGPYRIDESVGVWARGSLYRGFEGALSLKVLLKTLSPDHVRDNVALPMFEREARITACLYHPNIINLFALGEDFLGSTGTLAGAATPDSTVTASGSRLTASGSTRGAPSCRGLPYVRTAAASTPGALCWCSGLLLPEVGR
jgi:serine/threonine protein kinase